MKKILFGFLLLLNLFPLCMKAQELEWMKSYAALAPLREKKMAIDTNGNIITLGRKNNGFVLLKYSPTGNLIWDSVSSSITYPNCLALDKNNNIFVVGHYGTYSYMVVVKYNSDHILQWQKNINGSDIFDICVDGLGYSYITGETFNGSYNLFIYKLNPSGDTCWSSWTFDHTSGRKIIVDNQRNVIVTGGIQTNNGDIITIKCDSNGVQKWVKTFDGNIHHGAAPSDLKIDNNDFIYITGITIDSTGNYTNYLTIKYKPTGDTSWVREYAPGSDQNPHSIQIDKDRNVIVTGKIYYVNNERKLNVLKYDSIGTVLWSRFIDCPLSDSYSINSSSLDSSSNIYITGAYPAGNFNQYSKIFSAKYSPEGVLRWTDTEPSYNVTNKFYIGYNILAYKSNIYVCGSAGDTNILLKYTTVTNIIKSENNLLSEYKLYQNYPNPFNPTTKIKFDIPANLVGQTFLSVYDITGREIQILVNESLKPGSYEVTFDARQPGLGSNLASGLYFYKISAGDFSSVKKMILLK